MILHKIMRGENAGLYLPFGLARLRALERIYGPNRFFQQKFYVADATIEVTQAPPFQYVRVVQGGDKMYFEFFTTGKPILMGSVDQGDVDFTTVKAACVGVDVTVTPTSVSLSPGIRKGTHSRYGQEISLVKRAFQVQLIDEPTSAQLPVTIKQKLKYPRTVYESFAPMHSHTGVMTRAYNHGGYDNSLIDHVVSGTEFIGVLPGTKGSTSAHTTRDIGFDQAWGDGKGANPVREGLINDGTADWPRASGIQTVVDDTFGTREFAISIDAFSQVTVFPTSQIVLPLVDTTQDVDPTYVQTQSAGMPGWVYSMSERFIDWYAGNSTGGITEFPENDWKIAPDGTKACAVVYKRTAVTFDETAWTGTPFGPSQFADYALIYTGHPHRHNGSVAGSSDQKYEVATGLLEMTIAIALTGPNDEDFTLTVTTNTARDPETTDYCTLFAGYAGYDIPNPGGGFYAQAGDLCVWDIERYYRQLDAMASQLDDVQREYGQYDHERFWGNKVRCTPGAGGIDTSLVTVPLAPDTRRTLYSLKNLTAVTELRTLPAAPSGVCAPYLIAPFDLGGGGIGASTIDFPYGSHIAPLEPRAQFMRVDMTTLSCALLFQTATVDWRRVATNPDNIAFVGHPGDNYHAASMWYVYHPACAVYTFNQLREVMFPQTLPLSYSQPSDLYAEPDQTSARAKLTAAATDDFRATWLADDSLGDWVFMPLQGGPPGKAGNVDWTDTDMTVLRYWAIQSEAAAASLQDIVPGSPSPVSPPPSIDLCYWWNMIHTYASAINLTLINNPRFHWHMYADLIMNALAWTPWSTFYVHPNGTWALYDQSRIYNQQGVPENVIAEANGGTLDYTQLVDPTTWEHCIFDRVHIQASPTAQTNTTFRELYNQAVAAGTDANSFVPGQVFESLALSDLQASFSKVTDATVSLYGLVLQMDWNGQSLAFPGTNDTYKYADEEVALGLGFVYGNNTGTADLNLDYWFRYFSSDASPQAFTQRATFSSCLMLDSGR